MAYITRSSYTFVSIILFPSSVCMHCTACAGLLGGANRCFKQNAVRASPGSGAERFPVFMAGLLKKCTHGFLHLSYHTGGLNARQKIPRPGVYCRCAGSTLPFRKRSVFDALPGCNAFLVRVAAALHLGDVIRRVQHPLHRRVGRQHALLPGRALPHCPL